MSQEWNFQFVYSLNFRAIYFFRYNPVFDAIFVELNNGEIDQLLKYHNQEAKFRSFPKEMLPLSQKIKEQMEPETYYFSRISEISPTDVT